MEAVFGISRWKRTRLALRTPPAPQDQEVETENGSWAEEEVAEEEVEE